MSDSQDFRLIKPIKRFNEFYKETVFVIPCKVLDISDESIGSKHEIQLEVLNPVTGEFITVPGVTYKGSLKIFNYSKKTPPFITSCIVRKFKGRKLEFVVYGLFNAGLIESIYDVKGILNNDDDEIIKVFHSHYAEFNQWLKINE